MRMNFLSALTFHWQRFKSKYLDWNYGDSIIINGLQIDIHDMIAVFKAQLKATHDKCRKNIRIMYDHKRNFSVSYHPEIEDKCSNSKFACHQKKT